MTTRHLEIFIAVADAGKMSLAAKRLYIAQPTVSQVIAEIEAYYGCRMFERLSKKLYITEAGERLLRYARHIVSLFCEMEEDLKVAGPRAPLRVGASITIGSCTLPALIGRYEAAFPGARAAVYVDNTDVIENMVLKSELDLALVEGRVKSEELLRFPLLEDELVLACGENHPFAGRESASAGDLNNLDFVLREKGSGTRQLFENYLARHRVQVCPKWVCHTSEAILSAVAAGQGMTVLSRRLVEPAAKEKKLHIIRLDDAQLSRWFQLIYHKNKFHSQAMRAFIGLAAPRGEEDHAGS